MSRNIVNSVAKSLAILEVFEDTRPELGIAEIAALVKLPRPTVSRLVNTLAYAGYLEKTLFSGKYRLGIKLFHLGTLVEPRVDLAQVAAPVIRRLRDETGETSYLDVLQEGNRVCILSFESNKSLRTIVPVGQRSPLHAGADSRVLLAFLEPYELEQVLAGELTPFTSRTITCPLALSKVLAKVREDGYAISFGESVAGVVAVAFPVWDKENKVIAGVAVSCPEQRADKLPEYLKKVRLAAEDISRQLGCRRKTRQST
jgi:DNA-binding IclR family transcriptional regulator